MHHKDFFYGLELFKKAPKIKEYDIYLNEKNYEEWNNPENLTDKEILKLFDFIRKWDFHFSGGKKDFNEFRNKYTEIFPLLNVLKNEKIENIKFDKIIEINNRSINFSSIISTIFEKIANSFKKYESTDCSKIIHTFNKYLFVMWDANIRNVYLGNSNIRDGLNYAYKFLPKIQIEINIIINSYVKDRNYSRENAIVEIRKLYNNKTLAKLIDEYNWVAFKNL